MNLRNLIPILLILIGFSCQNQPKESSSISKTVISIENIDANPKSALINNTNSPFMPIKSVGLSDCHWTTGFWADRFQKCHDVMIPNMWSLVNDQELSHIYENFLVAAGEKEGVFKGFLFSDGDFYKLVEAMCYAYAGTNDTTIDSQLDKIISVIAKSQAENGYVTTGKIIGRGSQMNFDHTEGGAVTKEPTFIADCQHEFYNYGHLFTLACIHYRATGKTTLLNVAIKAADHLYDHFHIPSPELAAIHWNAPHIMGLTELYRTTGNKKYLELAETFINMIGTTKETASPRGLDHSQKRIPFREETQAVGHAGHANYLYCGVADVIAETGDTALSKSLKSIWQDVVSHKMYVTGATGSHNRFAIHDGVVGEAYGEAFDLPNYRGYAETCANIGNAMWNWRMFLMSGEAKYMDIVELVLYNSALSGISLDGKHFFYNNPLRYEAAYPCHNHDDGTRSEYLNCFCCPPNIVRTIAKVNNYAYAVSDKGVFINLYGSNQLSTYLPDSAKIKLTQTTNYPWEGNVSIKIDEVESKKSMALMLRIPGWADGATVKINSERVSEQITPGNYLELNRNWNAGDVIELELTLQPKLLEANPFLEDVTGQVGIQRGPVVYCLESHDLPEGVKISDVVIPQNIKLTSEYRKDELAGVTVLKGKVLAKPAVDWDNRLYAEKPFQKLKELNVQFIPYYSWNNRGATDMTVWMPVNY